jgi:hypothetical protein
VKWYQGKEGDQRIWFEPEEIEQIAEDELRKAKQYPSATSPVLDIERFLEGHLKASLDQFADLEPDVLGLTRFHKGRPPAVSINRDLPEAADTEAKPGVVGRWRATLAHESAHILLHRMLFELNGNGQSKTSADTSSGGHDAVMQCLKRDVGPGGRSSDWREVQANRGMAALLMPQRIFSKVAQAKIDETNLTELTPGSQSSRILAQQLAHHFSVSKQAASIRLETLSLISSSN